MRNARRGRPAKRPVVQQCKNDKNPARVGDPRGLCESCATHADRGMKKADQHAKSHPKA